MSTQISNKIIKIVAQQISQDPESIKEDVTLDSLGMDSLDRVEVVMKIEEEFDIEIDDEKADQIKSLTELTEYVQSLKT